MTERWVWTCTTDSSSVILLKVCHKGGEGSQGLKLESSANCCVYFASNRLCKVKYAVQDFSPLARCLTHCHTTSHTSSHHTTTHTSSHHHTTNHTSSHRHNTTHISHYHLRIITLSHYHPHIIIVTLPPAHHHILVFILFFLLLLLSTTPPTVAPASQYTNPVRLFINGTQTTGSRGTVQILYNGTWGSVCDDFWGFSNAQVVCRMLGYTNAIQAYGNAYFGQLTGPILLDNMQCTGQESELGDCQHLPWGQHNCVHGEDAGVSCTSEFCCVGVYVCGCICGVCMWCVCVVCYYMWVCLCCVYVCLCTFVFVVCMCGVLYVYVWCVVCTCGCVFLLCVCVCVCVHVCACCP